MGAHIVILCVSGGLSISIENPLPIYEKILSTETLSLRFREKEATEKHSKRFEWVVSEDFLECLTCWRLDSV